MKEHNMQLFFYNLKFGVLSVDRHKLPAKGRLRGQAQRSYCQFLVILGPTDDDDKWLQMTNRFKCM